MTPATRFYSIASFEEVTCTTPEKSLLAPLSKSGGRNNQGRITSRHRGGGHKRRYRIIDFKRNKTGVPAKVERIEYDPNRSAHIALLLYADGERRSSYGELAALAASLPVPESVLLKDPSQWTLIGTEQPRLDTPDKVAGRARFGRLPLHDPGH